MPNTVSAQNKKTVDSQLESIKINPKNCQPVRIEHEKTLQLRQPIKPDYYVSCVVRQSELIITSPESSRLGSRSLLSSRLESVRYSLS